MIDWTISYERVYSKEELKPIQDMILERRGFDEILDEFLDDFDFNYIDEAYIDLAIQLGWDADRYMKEVIEEQANLVLSYDGERSESLSKMMSNTAIAFVKCYLNGEEIDEDYYAKQFYENIEGEYVGN